MTLSVSGDPVLGHHRVAQLACDIAVTVVFKDTKMVLPFQNMGDTFNVKQVIFFWLHVTDVTKVVIFFI